MIYRLCSLECNPWMNENVHGVWRNHFPAVPFWIVQLFMCEWRNGQKCVSILRKLKYHPIVPNDGLCCRPKIGLISWQKVRVDGKKWSMNFDVHFMLFERNKQLNLLRNLSALTMCRYEKRWFVTIFTHRLMMLVRSEDARHIVSRTNKKLDDNSVCGISVKFPDITQLKMRKMKFGGTQRRAGYIGYMKGKFECRLSVKEVYL